jgi:hypothetical protein
VTHHPFALLMGGVVLGAVVWELLGRLADDLARGIDHLAPRRPTPAELDAERARRMSE